MGQTLTRLIADTHDFELVGGIDRNTNNAELLAQANVVIDFSAVPALTALLSQHGERLAGRALVVGTTGLTPAVQQLLADAARKSAVLVSANFSVGVNLMLSLVAAAARVLSPDRFDVEIVEAHHRRKVDAPSGTALALGKAIAEARGAALDELRKDGRSGHTGERPQGEIGFHALRAGDIVGEHRVAFVGARERLEIAHAAQDRALFAEGALVAARWLAGKPAGSYSMKDVLGLGA